MEFFQCRDLNRAATFSTKYKKSLRSLEKSTTKKLAAREPVRPEWMPAMQRVDSEARESKAANRPQTPVSVSTQNTRESSLTRNRLKSCSHHPLVVGAAESGQRIDPSEVAAQSSESSNSCGTQRSCSTIATQTEDISDELYLTNSLEKCSFDGASGMGERESASTYQRSNRYDYSEEEDLQSLGTYGRQQQQSPHNMKDDQEIEYSRDNSHPRSLDKDASDPEHARVGELNSAQRRCDGLISELNHIPLTSQSLWVRNRKAEIEKELAIVDEEIRIYSKPKLYINSSKNK
ncbi:uncharacterized protein LOC111070733 [Drosophila obscura]|uniref:uncharacterized protein LOC111070733 n=1 Tax=Drosophila obscura TaxID=7282 RepID=UPI001BB1073E|nr:uncharacterized protein LOC111070733 [Drosophila obscura]